jgi:hypothetical protein
MAIFSQASETCFFSGSVAFVNTAENAAGRPGAVHPTHKPREKCRCDRQLRQANHMTIEYLLCFRLARRYLSKTMQTLRISRRPFGVTVIQLSSSVISPPVFQRFGLFQLGREMAVKLDQVGGFNGFCRQLELTSHACITARRTKSSTLSSRPSITGSSLRCMLA